MKAQDIYAREFGAAGSKEYSHNIYLTFFLRLYIVFDVHYFTTIMILPINNTATLLNETLRNRGLQ